MTTRLMRPLSASLPTSRRLLQTTNSHTPFLSFNTSTPAGTATGPAATGKGWSKHSLPSLAELKSLAKETNRNNKAGSLKASMGKLQSLKLAKKASVAATSPLAEVPATALPEVAATAVPEASAVTAEPGKKARRVLRPRKALISLTPNAVTHLAALYNQPEPKLIRIGVNNRGCSGLTYNLSYVDQAGKFDEMIEQSGVKVLIDSKALFSIVGSEMDWVDDKLASKFVFKNPNSKGTCGCGESFMV